MSKIASIRYSDLLALAWSALRRNRLRSGLTIGAIAVGIGVMMFLISLGLGLEQLTIGGVRQSSALLSLTVTSPNEAVNPLTAKSLTGISKVANVSQALPQFTVDGEVALENSRAPATIVGADPGYLEIGDSTKLKVGRYYRTEDTNAMVVSTGFLRLFGLDENQTPLVTFSVQLSPDKYPGVPAFTNVSVTGVVGSSADSVVIYFPRAYLESVLGSKVPNYSGLKVMVPKLEQVPTVAEGIRNLGFHVDSVADTIDQIQQVFKWVQIILGTLGGIAILVASIGMFNTLTISLLERTKEIGIMKALGVRRGDINRLFLTEAFLMGALGGLSGIGLAFFFQRLTIFALQLLATLANGTVPILFNNYPPIVLGFFVFGIVIALVTGIYPARRAMKLNPIEAIRYE